MIDTQLIELAGRHALISQLLAGGVEVATPARDHGIDLIAYLDDAERFLACPLQLKANTDARFVVDRKYERFIGLLFVYAWNVLGEQPELYALSYAEAFTLLEAKGHTGTRSWEKGNYSLRVNDEWRELLKPYRMQPNRWRKKIEETCCQSLQCKDVGGQDGC